MSEIGTPLLPGSAAGLTICAIALCFGWRPGRHGRTLMAFCIAALVAHEVKDYAKVIFGRPWPETWTNNNLSWIHDGNSAFSPFNGGKGYFSFPSGHTSVDGAPMAVLWFRFPQLRPLIALLLLVVCVGLFALNFHFLGDMLAGLYLSFVIGYGVLAIVDPVRPLAMVFGAKAAEADGQVATTSAAE